MSGDYLKWKPVFVKILEDEYEQHDRKMSCHDASHHLRVWALARKAGKNYGHDPEVLIAACLLHDISAQRAELDYTKSQENDARIAEEYLWQVGFPKEKIPLVIDAIKFHGSDPSFKGKRGSIEAQLLCDADKLDVLGPLGVVRIVAALTRQGKSVEFMAKEYRDGGKIHRKFDAISLPELKERAIRDYVFSVDFFKGLAASLRD